MGIAIKGHRASCGDGIVLHPNCIDTLVVLLHYSPARCYYWRKVGKGTDSFSILFLTTACETISM